MQRRLAAILAADVAGFSALVVRDEEGAVRALKAHLSALEPVIGLNGGRVVKSTGDGFLAGLYFHRECGLLCRKHAATPSGMPPNPTARAWSSGWASMSETW